VVKKLMFTLLWAVSTPVLAQWEPVIETGLGTVYVRADGIQRDGDIRRVWVLIDRKSAAQSGSRSSRNLYELNCKDLRHRRIQAEAFSGQLAGGERTSVDNSPTPWKYPAPDTVDEAIMRLACAR
jgi:hypothetical protein